MNIRMNLERKRRLNKLQHITNGNQTQLESITVLQLNTGNGNLTCNDRLLMTTIKDNSLDPFAISKSIMYFDDVIALSKQESLKVRF